MGLGKAFDKVTTAATDFVIDRADSLGANKTKIRERFDRANSSNHVYKKHNLPADINLVDLFNGKIFSYVDFDAVIACLRKNNWSACDNLYTVNSLSKELVPKITLECLQARNARGMLKLYPGLIKLCIRHRRGLLVYIDAVSDKIYKITSIKSFLNHVELNDGVALRDIWIPLTEALPKLKPRKIRASITHEDVVLAKRAETREKNLLESVLPSAAKSNKTPGQTDIFKNDSINTLEIFRATYNCAQSCIKADGVALDDAFDILLHKLMNYHEDLSSLALKDYIKAIEVKYNTLGIEDFDTALAESSDGFMRSLRVILDIPEGTGESNNDLWNATYSFLLQTFDKEDVFECNTAKDMLELFFELKAAEDEAKRIAEEEKKAKLLEEENQKASATIDALAAVQKLSKERKDIEHEQTPQEDTQASDSKDLATLFNDKDEEYI